MPGSRLSSAVATPATNWRRIADYFSDDAASVEQLNEAIARLEAGDVTQTQFGIRVACNGTLGDKRVTQWKAYWPQKGCKCHEKHTNGSCSHELAATIFDAA